jgi:hypothetical protein
MGFGLVTGFINHLQVITTINYYTVADLHNLQSLHTKSSQFVSTNLHCPFPDNRLGQGLILAYDQYTLLCGVIIKI